MDVKQRAEELAASEKCVVCERLDKKLRRGLCNTDYTRWTNARAGLSDDEKERFDGTLIERGLLLPNRRGQKRDIHENVFASLLLEFQYESTKDTDLASEANQIADEAVAAATPTKKTPKKRARKR
jgi:hypothetical protein